MGDDPGRAWRIFHVNFLFFTALSQGAIIFAATQKVTKGVWAGPIIRFAEAMVAFLPVAVICFLLVFVGRHYLFPWIEHPTPVRGQWLTTSWVFWRDLFALLVNSTFSVIFVYHELRPDVAELKGQVSGWRQRLYERVAGDYNPAEAAKVERRINWIAPVMIVVWAYLSSLLG